MSKKSRRERKEKKKKKNKKEKKNRSPHSLGACNGQKGSKKLGREFKNERKNGGEVPVLERHWVSTLGGGTRKDGNERKS